MDYIVISKSKKCASYILHSSPIHSVIEPFAPSLRPPVRQSCRVLVLELSKQGERKIWKNRWEKKDLNIHNKTAFADCLDHSIAS